MIHPLPVKTSGLGSNTAAKEAIKVGFDYFKANLSRVSGASKAGEHDYHVHIVELQNSGATTTITLAGFIAACSGILQKPLQGQLVVLGDMSLGGNVKPVENLAGCMQLAFDCGAKRVLSCSGLGQRQVVTKVTRCGTRQALGSFRHTEKKTVGRRMVQESLSNT